MREKKLRDAMKVIETIEQLSAIIHNDRHDKTQQVVQSGENKTNNCSLLLRLVLNGTIGVCSLVVTLSVGVAFVTYSLLYRFGPIFNMANCIFVSLFYFYFHCFFSIQHKQIWIINLNKSHNKPVVSIV